jgi:MotA/TolQ/ExbB proton channel family
VCRPQRAARWRWGPNDCDASPSNSSPSHCAFSFSTAIGLIAAIPATIFYNKFISEVNWQAQRLEGFADEFTAILSRQINERR